MSSVYRFRRNRKKRAASQRSRIVRSRWHWLITAAFMSLALSTFAVIAVAFFVYHVYADDLLPPEQAIAQRSVGTSIVYDRTGEQLYEFIDPLGGLRDPVPLAEISPYMIGATIATEDASFYDNPGVNFRGLARAAIENLTPFGPGFLEGTGGSSITQQLVKNVYIQRDAHGLAPRTVERKIEETVIALELKNKYSDDQILGWYLNQVDYANHAFGVEAAALRYFGVHAKDLTLAQAAMLAGIPQAPGLYTPALPENQERAKARQLEVLNLMLKHKNQIKGIVEVTPEQIEAAKQEPLTYAIPSFQIKAPHFVFYVQDQVTKMCEKGLFQPPSGMPCDKVVLQGGLRITTTLEMGLQRIGEQTVESIIGNNEARYGGHDGALVAIRPETGEILTYVGSRDYFREDIQGQVDIASSLKSHGSTMKVFTYLTAFEKGWVPSTIVKDAPLELDAGGYRKAINNWNFSYLGNITIRKALSESVNIAAVNTVMEVGIDEMRRTAQRMGVTDLQRNDCGPTITLGSCEVKLLDQTFAYATVANNGLMRGKPTVESLPDGFRKIDPVSVLKITDSEGNVIYEFGPPAENQAIDPAYAYMITHILSNQAIQWSRLTLDRPAAAKTGTSEDFRDNVVMGYTPDLAVGVWMGNADNTPMANGTFSSAGTGPMWRTFMQEALAYTAWPARDFQAPANIVTSECGGRTELFVSNVAPTKPGTCRGPTQSSGTPTSGSTPAAPKFPPRHKKKAEATPTPAPEATPAATPSPTPLPTPELPVIGGGGD